MAFSEERKAGVDLWKVQGELRIQEMQELRKAILHAQVHAKRRMLDLSEVQSCDAAGLQLLHALRHEALAAGVKMDIPVWPEVIKECAVILGIDLENPT